MLLAYIHLVYQGLRSFSTELLPASILVGPAYIEGFFPVEWFGICPCWDPIGSFLHLSIIFSNFYQLLHFQSVKHHRASPPSVQLEFSLCWVTVIFPDTMYSWSLFRISLMWQPGSSTNARLLQARTWSPTMSAFRLPPEPCWEQGLLFPRCSCLTFPNQKAAKIKDVCTV